MNKYGIILSLFALSIAFSCKKNESLPNSDLGYDYYPQDTGHYLVYDVEEITWNDFYNPPLVDTQNYKIKELFESQYLDDANRECIRIERFRKNHDTLSWKLTDVWSVCVTNSRVEKTEENEKFVKLVFPVNDGQFWDGNLLNTNDEQEYTMLDAHTPYSQNTFNFNSTVTINQNEEISLIGRDIQTEIYERGVGMIYKRFLQVETETNGTVKSGFDITYKISDWN